ncbi:hypothetical protein EDB80DRAFT_777396 [Ilyonectria destructans]|nr:hypothetical protein EDB80DRAFT_777396 [Ilyonectria destructans]
MAPVYSYVDTELRPNRLESLSASWRVTASASKGEMLCSSTFNTCNIICRLWLIFVCGAYGFFPQQWKEDFVGHGGVSHIAQTNQAFAELAMQYFPLVPLTDSMKRARDTIADANAEVDDDQDHSALHFDGENFDGGQKRLTQLKDDVVKYLKDDNRGAARKSLGNALHTLQDFYAHSNWVELGNTSPHPDLGHGTPLVHAVFGDPTCKVCGTLGINPPMCPDCSVTFDCPDCSANVLTSPGLLTSGYYFGEDAPPKGIEIPAYKCHHGGATDSPLGGTIGFLQQVPYGGINKDSLNCVFSPHSYAHRQAAQLSIDATKQYINDIKILITEPQLKALFGVGPTLAFVIDTTSSMSDIIQAVREQTISIAQERLGTSDEASLYIISPFNDPLTGPVTTTSDFNTFQEAISSLSAEGGGDCPELAFTGLAAALDVVDEGASVFLFTDAEAKDAELAGIVRANALSRNVNIYSFKFDSNCDDSGSLRKRQDFLADEVYGAISLGTGGQYYSLPRPQANNITGLLAPVTKTNTVYIMKIADNICTPKTYKFPIDTKTSEFSVSLRGINVFITILKPDGSTLDLSSTGIAGRPGHTGYFPISGPPAYDHDVAAVANVEGANFTDFKMDFRDPSGEAILSPTLMAGSGEFGEPPVNSFFGVFHLKPTDVFAYVSGKDSTGAPFQRVLASLITPYQSNSSYTGISNSTSATFQNFTAMSVIPIANATAISPYANSTSFSACPVTYTSKYNWTTTPSSITSGTAAAWASTALGGNSSKLVHATTSWPSKSSISTTESSTAIFTGGAARLKETFGLTVILVFECLFTLVRL